MSFGDCFAAATATKAASTVVAGFGCCGFRLLWVSVVVGFGCYGFRLGGVPWIGGFRLLWVPPPPPVEHPSRSWSDRQWGDELMTQTRRKYTPEFRSGVVQMVRETRKPIAQVARDLGIGAGVLGTWVRKDKIERGEAEGLTKDERAELTQLRKRNAELEMLL